MCMTISIEKSIQHEKDSTDTTKTGRRQFTYKINPLILNRWSPRSMTGEELDGDYINSIFHHSLNYQPYLLRSV